MYALYTLKSEILFCHQEPILHYSHWECIFYTYRQFPNLKQQRLFLAVLWIYWGLCPTSFSVQSLVWWENPFSKQMERQNMAVKFSGWKQMALFLIFYVLLPKKGTRPSHSPFMNGRKLEIFVELLYLLSHISISYRCICFWKELCKFIIAICVITDWRETLFDYHMILDWAEK